METYVGNSSLAPVALKAGNSHAKGDVKLLVSPGWRGRRTVLTVGDRLQFFLKGHATNTAVTVTNVLIVTYILLIHATNTVTGP